MGVASPAVAPPAAEAGVTGGLRPIGVVAREVGLTARAIRYYEERGLLRPAVRVKGADRLFDDSDVQRLREIQRLREVIGFSLAEVAALLDADDVRAQLRDRFHGAAGSAARAQILREAVALAERRLDIVDIKLRQVQAFREEEAARLQRLRDLLATESRGDGGRAGSREGPGAAPAGRRTTRRVTDKKQRERSEPTIL